MYTNGFVHNRALHSGSRCDRFYLACFYECVNTSGGYHTKTTNFARDQNVCCMRTVSDWGGLKVRENTGNSLGLHKMYSYVWAEDLLR